MPRLIDNALVRAVARIPVGVQSKLLAAFAILVALLVTVGILGINALDQSNNRVASLGLLPERAAAYQEIAAAGYQLNMLLIARNTAISCVVSPTYRLCGPASPYSTRIALADIDGGINLTLSELGPLTNVANLSFVPPPDESTILRQIRTQYVQINGLVSGLTAGDDTGAAPVPIAATLPGSAGSGQEFQTTVADNITSDADDLGAIIAAATSNLQNQNNASYLDSQHLFIGVAAAGVMLALVLGIVLSGALVEPIKKMRARLTGITSGDFSGHVDVHNRDELGALVADLNRMNDELGRLYGELADANRNKTEFLANMSHELRTPLNAVIGFSEVLEGRLFGELNDKQAEYVNDIRTSGHHLLTLINDILDLSKIEAGRMDLQVSCISLPDVLQNVVALLRERATRQGIRMSLTVDPSTGVVESDERMVKQVLFNLLSNALKFTGKGGHVDVAAHADGDGVLVSVRDDGVGIAPTDHARIFEEFQQVGTSNLQEGTGLGLAISRRFIELHGGNLRIESEVGQGSTFTFTIPRLQSSAAAEDRAGSPDPKAAAAAAAPGPVRGALL
jgi:signal transduction histidine kinase